MLKQAELPELYRQVESLIAPTSSSDQAAWKKFASALANLLTDASGIGYQFHIGQQRKLNEYFAANELLLQCLDLATVSDRAAIKAGLLLPPGHDGVSG